MNKLQARIFHATQIAVLGIATLAAFSGHTNLAIAGISIYLISLHMTQGGN